MIFHFFKNPKKYRICDDLRAGQQNRQYRPKVVPMGAQCRERVFSTPGTRARAPRVIWGPSYALSRHLLEINKKQHFHQQKCGDVLRNATFVARPRAKK